MQIVKIVKVVCAWGCAIGALTLILVGHGLPVVAEVLAMTSIAFALAPVSW